MPIAGEILSEALARRRKKNSSYSLRALARDLDVSPTYLSLVIKGKKKLSAIRAHQISKVLQLSAHEASLLAPQNSKAMRFSKGSLDVDRFHVISDWYHLAILDLVTCVGFQPDPKWISKRLSLPIHETRAAISRLERVGLLKIEGDKWTKASEWISIPTGSKSLAQIREFHRQMINKALECLANGTEENFVRRDIRGVTISANPEKLTEAKKRIEAFQEEITQLLSEGACTEVYQFNSQLFPLTKEMEKSV